MHYSLYDMIVWKAKDLKRMALRKNLENLKVLKGSDG